MPVDLFKAQHPPQNDKNTNLETRQNNIFSMLDTFVQQEPGKKQQKKDEFQTAGHRSFNRNLHQN